GERVRVQWLPVAFGEHAVDRRGLGLGERCQRSWAERVQVGAAGCALGEVDVPPAGCDVAEQRTLVDVLPGRDGRRVGRVAGGRAGAGDCDVLQAAGDVQVDGAGNHRVDRRPVRYRDVDAEVERRPARVADARVAEEAAYRVLLRERHHRPAIAHLSLLPFTPGAGKLVGREAADDC